MFVRDAKARCPHLVIVPYDFEAYEQVADQFYSILHKHCNKVQALSCDEAFLDVTECADNDPAEVALMLRKEIAESTRCTASAGIASNLLLARLATRSAKPNGQCFIPSEQVDKYLNDLPIKSLPGIGHAIGEKLKSRQVKTCGQLRMIPKEGLHEDFGAKIGDMLWNYCRGIDNRTVEVVQEIKSIGAEVNWGVRFNDSTDCQHFLMKLSKEVSLRLQGCGVQGRTITLKIKKRKKGAKEPSKFMGHGDCDSISRSTTLAVATDNLVVLQRITRQIFESLHIDVKEIRGAGLQISRLESVDITKQGREENALQTWLATSGKIIEQCKATYPINKGNREICLNDRGPKTNSADHANQQEQGNCKPICFDKNDAGGPSGSHENRAQNLPPLHDLDMEVIKNLPPDIISEVNEMYNGKLCDFLKSHDGERAGPSAYLPTVNVLEVDKAISLSHSHQAGSAPNIDTAIGQVNSVEFNSDSKSKGKQPLHPADSSYGFHHESKDWSRAIPRPVKNDGSNQGTSGNVEVMGKQSYQIGSTPASCSRSIELNIDSTMVEDRIDMMPSSLSQADVAILQQLPEDVRADIYEILPAHRSENCLENVAIGSPTTSHCGMETQKSENSKVHLWTGNPPRWVEKFKLSNCIILNAIAELYTRSGTNGLLSSVLQSLTSIIPLISHSSFEGFDESISTVCDLLMQYIDIKIGSDIEELYICFRLLKRFTLISNFLFKVYNSVLPSLQAAVSENYGGELQLSFP